MQEVFVIQYLLLIMNIPMRIKLVIKLENVEKKMRIKYMIFVWDITIL